MIKPSILGLIMRHLVFNSFILTTYIKMEDNLLLIGFEFFLMENWIGVMGYTKLN